MKLCLKYSRLFFSGHGVVTFHVWFHGLCIAAWICVLFRDESVRVKFLRCNRAGSTSVFMQCEKARKGARWMARRQGRQKKQQRADEHEIKSLRAEYCNKCVLPPGAMYASASAVRYMCGLKLR